MKHFPQQSRTFWLLDEHTWNIRGRQILSEFNSGIIPSEGFAVVGSTLFADEYFIPETSESLETYLDYSRMKYVCTADSLEGMTILTMSSIRIKLKEEQSNLFRSWCRNASMSRALSFFPLVLDNFLNATRNSRSIVFELR